LSEARLEEKRDKAVTTAPERSQVQFKHLFTPLKIGTFTVRNRILSTAHLTGFAEGGLPTERHLNYWASKAKGGIGLIITEDQAVHPTAATDPFVIHAYRDACIEPFRRIVSAVHEHGAKLVAQLWHPGSIFYGAREGSLPLWSSAANPGSFHSETGHAMEVEEVKEIVQAFGDAARRMREAGLDGVELMGTHGFLIEQFMSPHTNDRSDEYGGSEESRLRFILEVIDAVRAAVGPDFTLGLRISGDQFQGGGLGLQDMRRIMPKVTAAGKLDYVSVTVGVGGAPIPPMYMPTSPFVYLAAGIKEVVDVPVFCVGRITDPVVAEDILAKNQADMVGMTRANLCDPELPNKAREGRLDEIRRCIGCNEGCWGRIYETLPITCALNPSAGREKEMEITPAPAKKRVMVIGAGIAGMEAARVAALRGHSVSLYEKDEQLGGQLQIAAKAPGRQDMVEPVRYYEYQFKLLGVDVHLGSAVDERTVAEVNPDAVIVATGGLPAPATVPGATQPNVVQARDVLAGKAQAGKKVVLWALDRGMEALTTADFLSDRGCEVEVLVPWGAIAGLQVEPLTLAFVLSRLYTKGVTLTNSMQIKAVRENTVVATNILTRQERTIEEVDTVVLALGSAANDSLYKALKGKVRELYVIGQALAPRKMLESTLDGLRVGRMV
jgi:mycofactocin system FadH/OYE family oxidoreductase 2